MYESPKLERLGGMRELTLGGGVSFIDPFGPNGNGAGCAGGPQPPITCHGPDPEQPDVS